MKKLSFTYIWFFIGIIIALSACSDDDASVENDIPGPTNQYSGILRAKIISNGSSSSTEGYITIDKNGMAKIELLAGSLKGIAQKSGSSYQLTLNEVRGGFVDVGNITGTIETSTGATNIIGTSYGGGPFTIQGTATPISFDPGYDTLQKAVVYFSHNEELTASITINGITIDGLNSHYHEGALCSSYYADMNLLRYNRDTAQSKLYCNSGTLGGQNGQPINFTSCSTAGFVLNKKTEYTYSVEWSDGSTSTGEFTTPDGGFSIFVCPEPGTGPVVPDGGDFSIDGYTTGFVATDCQIVSTWGTYALTADDYLNANTPSARMVLRLPSKPTVNGSYSTIPSTVVSPEPGQAALTVVRRTGTTTSDIAYKSEAGGQINVTIENGKIKASFNNVPMYRIGDNPGMTTVSGSINCPE